MSYVSEQLELLKKKNPGEPEFIQAATEVLESLDANAFFVNRVRTDFHRGARTARVAHFRKK